MKCAWERKVRWSVQDQYLMSSGFKWLCSHSIFLSLWWRECFMRSCVSPYFCVMKRGWQKPSTAILEDESSTSSWTEHFFFTFVCLSFHDGLWAVLDSLMSWKRSITPFIIISSEKEGWQRRKWQRKEKQTRTKKKVWPRNGRDIKEERKKVVGHKPVLWDLPMIRQRQFPLWVSSSLDIALPLMMTSSFFLSLSLKKMASKGQSSSHEPLMSSWGKMCLDDDLSSHFSS